MLEFQSTERANTIESIQTVERKNLLVGQSLIYNPQNLVLIFRRKIKDACRCPNNIYWMAI